MLYYMRGQKKFLGIANITLHIKLSLIKLKYVINN